MNIPKTIKEITEKFKSNGYQSYIVGGCVRDILKGEKPKDWDITTNANPEEIQRIFTKSFINNKFGTVTLLFDAEEESLKEIEVTPYRTEGEYTDKRRPDSVKWTSNIEEDLERRDFTINAIAINPEDNKAVDPYKGKEDLEKGIIRAVGDPEKRFNEDALRMLRAVRFFSSFNFSIEKKTEEAIKKNVNLISKISKERIRDEFSKIIMTKRAHEGIEKLRELGLLQLFIPELIEGYNVKQNKHHIYDCYNHAVLSLKYAVEQNFNFYIRMAALFHDIGKPKTKRGEGENATFYNHEIVGANMTERILKRLKFKNKEIEKITKLVRYHLFYYNVGEVGESSVRRLVKNVGEENVEDLIKLRMSDRIGSGVPKAEPYKLRHLKYLIEKASSSPISVSTLEIGGKEIIEELGINPGPKIGMFLEILLWKVFEDPEKNKRDILLKELKKLNEKKDEEIKDLFHEAKKAIREVEKKKDEMTKKKYWVI